MTTRAVDILIFAEDPGAANYVANLPDRLRARGWSVRLCTSGVATNYLSARGLTVDPLQSGCNFDDLITQLAPGLVLTGTAQSPDALGLSLIEAAKSMDIPVIGVIDASTVAEQVASLIARPKQPDPVALNRLFPSGALDMIVGAVEACIGKRK